VTLILETARLQLRPVTLSDGAFLLRLLNDPSWLENIGDRGVHSDADAEGYIRNNIWDQYQRYGYGMQALQLKSTTLPIGVCGLVKRDFLASPDLGFALLPQFVGHGYASEAARAVIAHAAQQSGIGRLYALVRRGNHRSVAVLGRLGFRYQGPYRVPHGAEVELYAADTSATESTIAERC
jgi:RimJ/RimL family protein N-acetyltransferase